MLKQERGAMEGEKKPWLMYSSGKYQYLQKNLNFCSISDPTKTYSRKIPNNWRKSLLRPFLVQHQHGWLLWKQMKSNCVSSLFLWNPLTLKEIMLPRLNHDCISSCNWILPSPPTTNDEICSIILISSNCPSIFYYQLGDKRCKWTKVCSYDKIVSILAEKGNAPSRGKRAFFEDPVYCNGCLYAGMRTSLGFIIVVIEKLKPDGFSINCTSDLMVKDIQPIISGFEQIISNLIGFDNVLFRIEVLHALDRVVAVFVYKFDCSQRVWEKAENIKNKVFFVSCYDSAFACQAINPETEGGRVYIALKNCNFVYIYNIEDKSLTTSQLFSNLSKIQIYPRWFMLETRMTDTLKKEIRKVYQIGEKKSICDVVFLKDVGDKAYKEFALPLDMAEVIAKYIDDVLDYLHFRATNKIFRLVAPPIQSRSSSSSTLSRFDDLSMCPIFVFSEKDKVFTFVHPKHGLEYKNIINFPEGQHWNLDSEICYSKDGWLLLVAVNKSFQVFFNPFTKEVLPLPFGNKEIINIRCFGMSHSPTSSECVIVELDKESANFTRAYVHLLEEDDLYSIRYEDKDFSLYNISPAFHNGLFYFLSVTGKLGVIEATEEEVSWKVLEKLQAPCSSHFNNFLVECDGNLLSVFESDFAKGVQVFKLNEDTMTWMEVKSLKNHMLFVGKTSFSAVSNIPEMENKIYFNRFYGDSVVFYSLETKNYHTLKNDEVVNFHLTRELLNGTWIQPRWH